MISLRGSVKSLGIAWAAGFLVAGASAAEKVALRPAKPDGTPIHVAAVLDVGGYYKNVFTLAPSFIMTHEEIDLAIDLLDQLFRRCRA